MRTPPVSLRPLEQGDATALVAHLAKPQLYRFIAPPPTTVKSFRRFIQWTAQHRDRHVCLGVVPDGLQEPVGLIQLWPVARTFDVAEWGFLLDDAYWGTGLFMQSAVLALDLFFGTLGVRRLEARSAAPNGRGNGVLHKLGATHEGVLRRNFRCQGIQTDHHMWSMLADEWPACRPSAIKSAMSESAGLSPRRRDPRLGEAQAVVWAPRPCPMNPAASTPFLACQ